MWWNIGKCVLRVFIVLWMTAIGGILGANLLAIIGTLFFVPENKGVYVQPWSHAGWYLGSLLFFFGAVSGRLRFFNGTGLGSRSAQTFEVPATSTDGVATTSQSAEPQEPNSVLMSILAGGLAGGFLGFLLGANLLIFWFSLAFSPFAPKQVVSSVKVVEEQRPGSVFKRPVMRSNHPVALYLCLTPAAVGGLAGATAAGVIASNHRGKTQPNEFTRMAQRS
jgi:hypothetical protein